MLNGGMVSGSTDGNWGRTNYAYNGFEFWPSGWNATTNAFYPFWDDFNSGVGGISTSNSLAQITDGSSHTIMLGEIRVGVDGKDRRGVWAMGMCGSSFLCRQATNGESGPNSCNADDDIYFATEDRSWRINSKSQLDAECMWIGWVLNSGQSVVRSRHPGGVQVAMADASVQFISDFVQSGAQGYQGSVAAKIRELDTEPQVFGIWQRLNVARDGYIVGTE